jgi:hypothetical protein
MSYEEMAGWFTYFNTRPIGWREDQRTFMLLSAQGVKAKAETLFPSLRAISGGNKPTVQDGVITDANKFKSSGLFAKILKAKGGDDISGVFDENNN